MPTVLPTRWPASVNPSQALGYLLARHVPTARLPEGLTLVREAAGWLPPVHLRSRDLGMHPATVRSWMYAARDHARILGPPPGLTDLLALLGDGAMRTAGRARSMLEAAGAEELADPRTLADFAGWCGAEVNFVVLPLALRQTLKAEYIVPEADDLPRARSIVEQLSRRYGLCTVNRALAELAAEDLRLDAGNDAEALRDLLRTAGYSAWLWPHRNFATPLSSAMHRISAFGIPIPLEQIPVAVARCSIKRWPRVPGEWPLPLDALRAWVNARDDWRLTSDDQVEPVGPLPEPHWHDQLIHGLLDGKALHWTELHEGLMDAGLTSPSAGAAIYRSPLLRRHRQDGYFLIGTRDASPKWDESIEDGEPDQERDRR